MLIIYSLIIILTFSAFGYIVLNNYKIREIKGEETRLFQAANIMADIYKRNKDDIVYTRIMVKTYAHQINGRILIVNQEKEVLVDSFNSYIGKTLNNREIREGLKGKSTSGIYQMDGMEVLQISVPITISNALGSEVVGSVLISTSLNSVNENLSSFSKDILRISLYSLLAALLLTAISATGITKSMRALTNGVEKISTGHLGYRIEERDKGEVGALINTFNEMSQRLRDIERNRKYFINSISHELKTPLTSIKALIDSLNMGNNTIEVYEEYLNDIRGETERMESLVNYLMGSIKLEDLSLAMGMVNLNELIEETVKFMIPYASKHNVDIRLKLLAPILAKCDRNKIREVLLNLIENGIKYRDKNKEANYISIITEKTKTDLFIIIEDNGLGIDKENLDNIFQRGFRVLDNHRIEGYGIGLPLVKNILDKHGWDISLESSLGEGSKFIISIKDI